jgi:hypothetical protein
MSITEQWEIHLEGASHSVNHNGTLPKLIKLGSGEIFQLMEHETQTLGTNSRHTFGKAYYQIAVMENWSWLHTSRESKV